MIKSRNYSRRPTISLRKAKRTARRKTGTRFFLKLFILLALLAATLGGGYWGGSRLYRTLRQIHVEGWRVKTIAIVGVEGELLQKLSALAAPYQHQTFSIKQAVSLRETILHRYPMLTGVSVKRRLLTGKLLISARRRVPLARFVRPDGSVYYIDTDSTIYADPHPDKTDIPLVELVGEIPDKLNAEFVGLVENTLKLHKELHFAFLRLNVADNTVRMRLADGAEIDFGKASYLRQKVDRAAQVVTWARKKYTGPFTLDFQFFENGKVFLTQKAS